MCVIRQQAIRITATQGLWKRLLIVLEALWLFYMIIWENNII